jgi:hypothetical protein
VYHGVKVHLNPTYSNLLSREDERKWRLVRLDARHRTVDLIQIKDLVGAVKRGV